MEKRKIAAGEPIRVGKTTIVPVIITSQDWSAGKRYFLFSGKKEPVALVLVTPEQTRAFDMSGQEILLEQLERDAPGLTQVLASL